MPAEAASYQSLYRRFRPQRFADVKGQDHVVRALQNAVRDGRVSHAYLFSGPRGTGKTSMARILAKALNCTALADGEPCGTCDSCVAVQSGSSLDVFELDAASNNGVDAMRDLVARASLATPGRTKVYIVDEVHMLSTAASNALLKTLEEPPDHVVFVLATTDPQKVLPTIVSRTQHFAFKLLPAPLLGDLVKEINTAAGLALDDDALQAAVRRGAGSARDTLSALDQVAAAGAAEDDVSGVDAVVEGLCERDVAGVLAAVAACCAAGRDPRRLATETIEQLRNGMLAVMAPDVVALAADETARVADQAKRLGTPALVRALEVLGEALIDMRDALDTRVTFEVALVRLARPDADASPAALLERIERLERRAASAPAASAAPAPAPPAPAAAPQPSPDAGTNAPSGPASARAALGAHRATAKAKPADPAKAAPVPTAAPAAQVSEAAGDLPSKDELTLAWGDHILDRLATGTRARFKMGRFVGVEDGAAVFGLPNPHGRDYCEERRTEVEAALAEHFGRRVPLRLVVDGAAADAPAEPLTAGGRTKRAKRDPEPEAERPLAKAELAELDDAGPAASPEERLLQAFPGAEEVEG